MIKPQPQVRFRIAWQTYRVGGVITPPATLRDWLLQCGYVELVEDNTPKAPLVQRVKNAVNRALPKAQVSTR